MVQQWIANPPSRSKIRFQGSSPCHGAFYQECIKIVKKADANYICFLICVPAELCECVLERFVLDKPYMYILYIIYKHRVTGGGLSVDSLIRAKEIQYYG